MSGVDSATDFLVIFNIFIGGILLYYAIVGKGRLFEGEYPKEMMEAHVKLLRKFCWYVSIPFLVLSFLEYAEGFGSIWSTLCVVYGLSAVVIYIIIFQRRFGRYLRPQKNGSGETAISKKNKKDR